MTTDLACDFAGSDSGPRWLPKPSSSGIREEQRVLAVEYAGSRSTAALWALREGRDAGALASAVAAAWQAVVRAPGGYGERFADVLAATTDAAADAFDDALAETRQFSAARNLLRHPRQDLAADRVEPPSGCAEPVDVVQPRVDDR